jgi:amino acid permease
MTRGDALRGWVARPALLVLWALVLWGTLLLLVAAVDVVGSGARAFRQLLPAHGASLWAWLNAVSVALALAVWLAALLSAWTRRRGESEPPPDRAR